MDVGDVRSDLRKVKRDGVGGGSEEVGANGGAKVWRLSCTLLSKCIAERSVGDEAVSPGEECTTVTSVFSGATSLRMGFPI